MTKLSKNTLRISSGQKPLPAVRVEVTKSAAWDTLVAIEDGLWRIDYGLFRDVVMATTGSTSDYAAAMWAEFIEDRLGYCMTRVPEKQGYALVNLAVKLNKRYRKEKS